MQSILLYFIATLSTASSSPTALSQSTTLQCGTFSSILRPLDCSHVVFEPWKYITDTLIQKTWAVPARNTVSQGSEESTGTIGEARLASGHGGELVLRFTINTEEEYRALAEATNILFLDVWESNKRWFDIRITNDELPALLGLLPASLQHAHKPLMHERDLLKAIADSYSSSGASPPSHLYTPNSPTSSDQQVSPSAENTNIFFQNYQSLSVIAPWMQLMQSLFPTHVQIINVGKSYEGRNISAFKLGTHSTNEHRPKEPRPTIVITGGLHAREWISVSTVNYIAYSLITSYGKNRKITKLLDTFDWILVPTLNPDGYVYTWEIDRLWRKNRQPTPLRFCRGIDLDRSWGFHWNNSDDTDTSNQNNDQHNRKSTPLSPNPDMDDNPCSESYAGSAPFAANETSSFADWAGSLADTGNAKVIGLLDLHSYSQEVLYPYSYSCTAIPPSLEDLEELGLSLARAIHRTCHRAYTVAPACASNIFGHVKDNHGNKNVKENVKEKEEEKEGTKTQKGNPDPGWQGAGGSQLDWMYHALKVRHAFQIKLPDTGSYGFLLPKEEIVPTGREMLGAVMEFGKFLLAERDESTDGSTGIGRDGAGKDSGGEEEMGVELKRRRR